ASGSSASTSDSSTGPYVPSPSADTATGSGATAAQDPLMQPGDRIKAHSDDNVVSGKIARVSRRMVVIETDAGEQKPVFIVPETQIQVDGQDAQRSDLKQGQDVRASFNNVDGRDVAVVIHAGAEANASPDDPNAAPGASSPSSPGMDSSGSSPSGSRQ
ncbi:MAG TPA: hypothetical protein VIW03_10710, partial [Anaeromyxobacter sp.]